MARYALFAYLLVLFAVPASADLNRPSDLTIILDFRGPHSGGATREMQKEAAAILKAAGVSLSWRPLTGASSLTYNDLVVMTFTGPCEFDPDAPTYDELGPYARTWISDGEVLPFGQVDCSRVVSSVRGAMLGEEFDRADQLVGRALGRVVAHELVHMLTRSAEHGKDGVEMAALSGRQLIGGPLRLEAAEVLRLRARVGRR